MTTHVLYRMFDSEGVLLYVGISNGVTRRINQHIQTKAWFASVALTTFEHYATREDAILYEKVAIRTERPAYNLTYHPNVVRPPVVYKSDPLKGYKTLSQMAQLLEVDTSALRHAIRRGTLKAEIEGKTYFVTDAEVTRYQREHRGKQGSYSRKPKASAHDE